MVGGPVQLLECDASMLKWKKNNNKYSTQFQIWTAIALQSLASTLITHLIQRIKPWANGPESVHLLT